MNNTKKNDCIHERKWEKRQETRDKRQETRVAESCWLTTN